MTINILVNSFIMLFFLVTLLILLLKTGKLPRSITYFSVKNTDLKSESIYGLPLDTPLSTLPVKETNMPLNIFEKLPSTNQTYTIDKGLEVHADPENQKIRSIITTNPKCATQKGIKVGDNQVNIYWQYGMECYKREESGMLIQGYIDRAQKTTLEFGVLNQRIQFIHLSNNPLT